MTKTGSFTNLGLSGWLIINVNASYFDPGDGGSIAQGQN
jgi:hypothetical protein